VASDPVPASTARLTFRRWRDDDLLFARALFGDPSVTALVGGPFSDDQVRARLATEIATEREHGYQYWPIALHDGTDVGCCGLKPRDPAQRCYELGFYLLAAHWGHGYAVEAGQSVIGFAFDQLGASSLFAGHHPDNASSRRTLAKLGFRFTHDELYPPTGLMHPGYELRR
jgi:[ribosomal protein S5]-alanine N-acetyltransferase